MFSSTNDILQRIRNLYKEYRWLISYRVEEKSVSIIKAKIIFNEEMFIQVYVNIRRPKISYNLILRFIKTKNLRCQDRKKVLPSLDLFSCQPFQVFQVFQGFL